MNKQEAEKVIAEYVKPIFGFALKRCKSQEDAEDLSQEIVLKAFRSLLIKDDIQDMGKFIWAIAHNALSNYYRSLDRVKVGTSIEEVAETLADPKSVFEEEDDKETLGRLQKEIAYLSKLQRRIVIAYYFENRKQAEIAEELKVPVGTVKWHLFEAKKELKRGMEKMRDASELKFNPIKFDEIGISGSMGTKSPEEFLRSTLSQNICYSVRKADALGVSPVFVEGEVEFLEEYGLLLQQKEKYIANFIIRELTEELLVLQENMYEQAAELFANDLYDELINSGLLKDESIECGWDDTNFLLWSLIPYITAWSGEKQGKKISFEEVMTIRPDGAENIYFAAVRQKNLKLPESYRDMKKGSGPLWNANERQMVWQLDSQWTDRGKSMDRNVSAEHRRLMNLYDYEQKHTLSQADYAWLAEKGYIRITGNYGHDFKATWQIVILKNAKIREKLIALGEKLQEKYRDKFCELQAPYEEMVLAFTPAHLQKISRYTLQYTFDGDDRFLLHCYQVLLRNGKLRQPTEGQRKALSTILCLN